MAEKFQKKKEKYAIYHFIFICLKQNSASKKSM